MMKKEIKFTIECKRSIGYCFCCCPYCGNTVTDCSCKTDKLAKDKILTTNQVPNPYNKPIKTGISSYRSSDHDWWRLEKWQVGRRNFP